MGFEQSFHGGGLYIKFGLRTIDDPIFLLKTGKKSGFIRKRMAYGNQERPPAKSAIRYFRVDRREIGYFRFILEACNGVAALRTIDPRQGVVAVHIAFGRDLEFEDVLSDLNQQFCLEPLESDAVTDDPCFG